MPSWFNLLEVISLPGLTESWGYQPSPAHQLPAYPSSRWIARPLAGKILDEEFFTALATGAGGVRWQKGPVKRATQPCPKSGPETGHTSPGLARSLYIYRRKHINAALTKKSCKSFIHREKKNFIFLKSGDPESGLCSLLCGFANLKSTARSRHAI